MNQAFSKIWVGVIVLILLIGGIFTFYYFSVSKREVGVSEIVPRSLMEYKKIGVVYISESEETYNPNWRGDLYPLKSKIENALNEIFNQKGIKFIVDFLGEYRANNLCWNPAKIAFELENPAFPGSPEKRLRLYIEMPGSWFERVNNDIYFPKRNTILWSNCPLNRCEEYNRPDFPGLRFFRAKCNSRQNALLMSESWTNSLMESLKAANLDLSDYDYKIFVMGKSGPIIPQDGEREKYYFCTTAATRISGYAAGDIIVMSENGLKRPSYYVCEPSYSGGGVLHTKFSMPAWQQIIHEILHSFGACDVYDPGLAIGITTCRDEALKLEPAEEVDKSIMAQGWAGYCTEYEDKYSCTPEDTEKVYLDRYNRIKLGLEEAR